MALSSSKTTMDLQVSRKWKGRDHRRQAQASPERTKVWTEPNKSSSSSATSAAVSLRKVPVIYYLSRNGQLEHPHFMDVPLSSPDGLSLEDVINRLNLLRGKGMASMYSWSSKRSYNNGFVWHDLSENDIIHPAHGQEYVLKGSEIVDHPSSTLTAKHLEMASSSFRVLKLGDDESADVPVISRRRNQSWSSIDLNEYKVYKAESLRRLAADASTQTDDKRRRRRPVNVDEGGEEQEQKSQTQATSDSQTTELSREDISPPPSDSSPETLESLMKADGRLVLCSSGGDGKNSKNDDDDPNRTLDNYPSVGMKASTVLMQLISCGSISFKDCGPVPGKDQGRSLIGQYKARVPRCPGRGKKETGADREIMNYARVRLEDKEYFSGSLIESSSKKEEVPSANLKRSNSCNADRSAQLQLAGEEDMGGVTIGAKCIPRKPKAVVISHHEERSDSSGQQQRTNL